MKRCINKSSVTCIFLVSVFGCKPARRTANKSPASASTPTAALGSPQLIAGVQTWCPNFYSQNHDTTPVPPTLKNGVCWYIDKENQSCEIFCEKFYGVDTTAMSAMTTNPDNLCACVTYGFPDYGGLGITYHNAAGTVGAVGKPMSIVPTFLNGITNPTIYNADSKPDGCAADASTPLPKGLSIDSKTCVISGIPVEALEKPTTYFIRASNSNYSRTSSLGLSKPAPVVITITRK